ncbi:MAG: ABC transporter permease, partial [Bacteroidota bacterium]
KPWGTALSLILAALGAGLISLLLLVSWQFDAQLKRNLADINLVIGAKGSPLQLIMSSMYHVQYPNGNITIGDVLPYLNPEHPFIERSVPLSLGDSHKGRRIVGTTPDFLEIYQAEVVNGRMWENAMEVVAGAQVAADLDLELGGTFASSHGLEEDSLLIHEDAPPFIVVGILGSTGSVADQLLLTSNQSTWVVHSEHGDDHDHSEHDHDEQGDDHDHEGHDHDEHDHDHEGHDHGEHDNEHGGHDHDHDAHHHDDEANDHDHTSEDETTRTATNLEDLSRPLTDFPDKDITSLLLQFKGNSVFSINLQRAINENTGMLAAAPSYQIDSLYDTLSPGENILQRLAQAIVLVSILSIFISLYTSLDERRKELALLRSLGGSRGTLLNLLLTEGVILAVGGALLGLLLSHLGLYLIARYVSVEYRYDFSAFFLLREELWLLLAALVIGLVAALIPAWRAASTDVHQTLAE